MLNEYIVQGLQYIINLSNGINPETITAIPNEKDAIELINYAGQILDVNSENFNNAITGLKISQYCDTETLKLVNTLKNHSEEISEDLYAALINKQIPGEILNRTITELCLTSILKKGYLSQFKDYVNSALTLIQNSNIQAEKLF
jgi:hypothetical protein